MDVSVVFVRLRQCATPSNTCFHRPNQVQIPNGILIGSLIFAQLTKVVILYNGPPLFPLKIAPNNEGI